MSDVDTLENIKSTLQNAGFDNASVEKIMDKFVVIDKNLILKTDLENSVAFTRLMVIAETFKRKKLMKSYKTLNWFIEYYIRCRVSHHRLSRKEILDAISAIKRESNNSVLSNWLGTKDKKDE